MQATKTIPIVMFTVADPLGQGFVTSLARPGGNVTGLSSVDHGLLAKQFELLLQAAPQVRRVGVVYNPDFAPHLPGLRDVETVAQRQGVQVRALAMRTPGEIDATFDALQRERVEAVHFFLQPFLNTGGSRARGGAGAAAALADGDGRCGARARRHPGRLWLQERGPAAPDAALRDPHPEGTPPGEMPVEQPTRFYAALNLKTAKALGLALPQSLLLRADELIE